MFVCLHIDIDDINGSSSLAAASKRPAGQWQLMMENEPASPSKAVSDIAIVTTHSPVTCRYIYSSPTLCRRALSLQFFSLASCVGMEVSHGPALRGASHQAQGSESIFGCFATRHVYMSAVSQWCAWGALVREKNNLVTKYHEDTGRPSSTVPSLLFFFHLLPRIAVQLFLALFLSPL